MTWTVILPWPGRVLSPNARVHWIAKAKATKAARRVAWALAREAGVTPQPADSRPRLSMTFAAPDRRRRDLDNCISATKAARDGIADALRVDDSRFAIAYQFAPCTVPGGQVVVEIHPQPPEGDGAHG